MAVAPMEMRQQSMQQSILFMQQEHANTLKGLHSEIEKLQKRCSELTFKLAMESTSLPDNTDYQVKYALSAQQTSKLENELQEQVEINNKKERKINKLEHQIVAQEKRFQSELKAKEAKTKDMATRIDQQAGNIAYLTEQLHKQSVTIATLKRRGEGQPEAEVPRVPEPPPKSGDAKTRFHRRQHNIPSLHKVQNRPPSGRRLATGVATAPEVSSPEPPDPSPFLAERRPFSASSRDMRRSSQPPLPPIATINTHDVITGSRSRSSSPEVQVLAVRPTGKGKSFRKLPQASNETITKFLDD